LDLLDAMQSAVASLFLQWGITPGQGEAGEGENKEPSLPATTPVASPVTAESANE